MRPAAKKNVEEILKKYQQKLEKDLNIKSKDTAGPIASREYSEFKKQYLPKPLSIYEKWCGQAEKLLKIKVNEIKKKELEDAIDICHLEVTPSGVSSLAIIVLISILLFGGMFSFLFNDAFFFIFLGIVALSVYLPLNKFPKYIAANWRMKASNQMVLSIFYVVTYMRHTSNLELGVDFAAEHLNPPLSLDFKKMIWDVQTEKYSSIKEALDIYLDTWKKWNMEFVEAFHLIESSLYEGDEGRRIEMLDKSLDVMLEETYEKMLHYAQNLKSPITTLHMMGIILPILGLVILPLVVNFMDGIKWYHIAILYNLALPIGLYFLGRNILSNRPTGYGDTDISAIDPEAKKLENIIIKSGNSEIKISSLSVSIIIAIFFLSLGLTPLVLHFVNPHFDYVFTNNGDFGTITHLKESGALKENELPKFELLGYRCPKNDLECGNNMRGPYGIGSTLISLLIPLGIGSAIGLYYKIKSDKLIKIRNKAKELEREFASALFQLGNRLGDGIPAELAFTKVAKIMEGTVSGNFFRLVEINIKKLGVDVERAIFNPKYGALISFPSSLIESSMKVLSQSIKKGPRIAAVAMINVSKYIKEIHKVDERLKDLMSDVISDMKQQIHMLTPAIAGIVIGITSMITTIVGKISATMNTVNAGAATGTMGGIASIFSDGIPTYYFQIIIGIYVVQITYILSILANGVENGADKLNEEYSLGNNLSKSTILYCFIALVIIVLFNLIAGTLVSQSLTG